MAGRKGDVELVIRAKDAATQAIESVTKAIEGLVGTQNDLTKSALKTDSTLGRLTKAFDGLGKELRGATVGQQVARALDSATKASDRLNKSVESTKAELADLADQQAKAQAETARLTAEMNKAAEAAKKEAAALERAKKAVADQTGSLRQAASDRKQLEAADARLTEQIGKQIGRVDQAQAKFAKLSAEIGKTASPAKTLQSAFERSTESLAKQQAKLADLQQTQGVVRAAIDQTAAAEARFAGQLEQANGAFERQKSTLAGISSAYTELKAAVSSAGQQQKTLDGAAEATADALARQTEAVNRAEVELAQLKAAAGQADAALAALAAGSTAKLTEAFNAQRRSMLETKREWVSAQAAVKTLAQAMAGVTKPTQEQAKAWNDALIAARAAKQEYLAQRDGLQKLAAVLSETGGDIDKLVAQQERFIAVQAEVGAAMAKVRDEAAREAAQFEKLNSVQQRPSRTPAAVDLPDAGKIDRLSQAYKELYGNTRLAMSFTQRLRGEVLSLIAAYGGIFGVINALGQVIDAYKQLEAATSRLRVVFEGNQQKTIQELDFLRRTADRLGISFGDLADEYGKFAVATKGTNINAEQTRHIFVAVAQAARVNKISLEDTKGVFTALTQIVSKGKVQMEELRQQLGDRLPGAIQIMADALGVGTDKLFAMVKANEVGSDALIKFADELDKRFGSQLPAALQTTTTALGQFGNAVLQALLSFGKAGFIKSFTDLIRDMTKTLKSADFTQLLIGLSKGFAGLIDILKAAVDNFKLLAAAAAAFAAIKLTPLVVALGASFLRLIGVMATVRSAVVATVFAVQGLGTAAGFSEAAVGRLAIATRVLLSATGVGLALTAVAVAFSAWATTATDATAAMVDLQKQLDIIKNGFDAAKGSADEFAKSLTKVSTAKILSDLIDLRKALDGLKPKTIGGLFGEAPPTGSLTPGVVDAIEQVNNLTKAFNHSLINLDHYKKELGAIAEAGDDEWLTKFIADQVDLAEKLQETRDKIKLGEAALRVIAGTATEADKQLLDMGKSAEDAADDLLKAQDASDAWTEALGKVQKGVKGVNDELESFHKLIDLTQAFKNVVEQAKSLSEVTQRVKEFNDAAANIGNEAFDKSSGSFVDNLIAAESGGSASAKNSLSSATGLGQFITSTWLKLFKENFPDRAKEMTDATILELRKNADVSRQMILLYARDNAKVLTQAGLAVNKVSLDLAHFLGPKGAIAVLTATASARAEDILGPGVIKANPQLAGKTAGDIVGLSEKRQGISKEELAARQELSKLDEKAAADADKKAEKAKEYHDELAATILAEAEQNSLKQQGIIAQETAKALAEAEAKAKAAGTVVTQKERDAIIANTKAKFAEKQATDDIAAAEQRVTDLVTQRNELQKQLQIAKESGDTSAQAQITAELKNVNAELLKAIDAAIAFHQALGGPGADADVAKLQTIAAQTKQVSTNAQEAYLDWNRVGQLFASGLTNAFDEFAQAVANGEDVGEAARKAFLKFASDFLRQIAQMIIQQAILNALRGLGLGGAATGGGGGLLSSLFHSGGVVGRGGTRRLVDPSVFIGAPRFHDGRMPGLRSGEVASILQKDEEVLSKDDPRNIRNGGAAAGGAGGRGGSAHVGDTVVANFFDTDSFLQSGLTTKVGDRAILNHVRANQSAWRTALGVTK